MKTILKLVLVLTLPSTAAVAQVAPAATGPRSLPFSKSVEYTFRYAQTEEHSSSQPDWATSSFSGSADYSGGPESLPFALSYTGGYTWTLMGPDYTSGLFQHLLLSQGIIHRKWNLALSDDVSYRPQAPVTGFSGIPGIGEPIGAPPTTAPSDQLILTLNAHVVENAVQGAFEHNLNHALSFNAGGTSELLRYPDGNGLDTDTQMGNAGLAWRLNARNSLSTAYMYSFFSYPGADFSFQSNSAVFGFTRQWKRSFSTSASAGPQWTSSSSSSVVPSSLGVTANATATYQFRTGSAGLTYSREANGGAGYLFGAESDNVNAHLSKSFGKKLSIGVEGSYRRLSGLANNGVTTGKVAGGEINRHLGRYIELFANYTATDQTSSSALPGNTLNGLLQVVGFGISYTPRESHLGN